jgi:glyoxylate reductase
VKLGLSAPRPLLFHVIEKGNPPGGCAQIGSFPLHVFVTRQLPGTALGRLRALHSVTVWPARLPPSPDELRRHARRADGLVMLLTDEIDASMLHACPRARAISNYAVGFENIDIAAAIARGIPVGHTPGVLTGATAQLAITLTLDLLRRVSEAGKAVHQGSWRTRERAGYLGTSLSEVTLGLVGYGRIGQAVAALALGLGMRVIYTGTGQEGYGLAQVLAQSDDVSLHAPLTPETRGLLNARTLAAMRPGTLLVNVARGAMVDTAALTDAVCAGHLAGAGLDVTDQEPLPVDHELLTFPNVIVTPHIASATVSARSAMADLAVVNLLAGLDGQTMPHCANPGVYARPVPSA